MEEVLPLMVVFGVPVLGIISFTALVAMTLFALVFALRFFAYKDRELDLRRMEVEGRLQHAKLLAGAPPWLDRDDPDTILAWWAARSEVAKIEAHPRAARRTAQG